MFKLYVVFLIDIPIWDTSVYLVNARNMLHGEPLYEWFRPPFVSALIASIWAVAGENLLIVKPLDVAFTAGSGLMLYLILRRQGVGHYTATLGAILFLTSTQVLLWSDYILTHASTTFFTLLAVFFLFPPRSHTTAALGGLSAALAFLSRYTTIVILGAVLIGWVITHRRLTLVFALLLGALIPILLYTGFRGIGFNQFLGELLAIYNIHGSNPGDPSSDSPFYYAERYWDLFKVAGFVALAALLQRATYTRRGRRVWVFWLLVAFLFGALTQNRQLRFTFEWTPAVVALAALALHGLVNAQRSRPKRILAVCVIVAVGVSSATLSVNQYIQTYETHTITPAVRMVSTYLESETSSSETAVSNWVAPILTYLSKRTTFGIQDVESIQDLKAFLEHGYGHEWTDPSYVILAEGRGRLPLQSIQDVEFLRLEHTITLPDGTNVHFHRYLHQ